MTFPTFPPPLGDGATFGPGSSESFAPMVLVNSFGDGYKQRIPDGLNTNLRKVSARWDNLTRSEARDLLTFFSNQKGCLPFYMQLPGETEIRKWICPKWDRTWPSELTCNITASWEEVVDPDV